MSVENPERFGFDAIGKLYPKGDETPLQWGVVIKRRNLEPREAELLGARLAEVKVEQGLDGIMVIAPFVSEAAAELLAKREIGYWDASGNCRISSGALYIERKGFPNRYARQASQGSPFTRAGKRLLRPLLDPEGIGRTWTLRDLAKAAYPGVSLGQAHALAKLLENQNHIIRGPEGIQVRDPGALLRAWAREAKAPRLTQRRFYSPLSQDGFRKRFEEVLPSLPDLNAALASFTAASEWAPFVRQHRSFLYWSGDLKPLQDALSLQAVPDGENVVATLAPDEGIFYGRKLGEPPITCAVQTYIDLMHAGGRGEEAAEHLFERILKPRYQP
ncbi:type IV toxin-antitoxin system AbiEi family antitoxin [Mesoterricola silvestris]|uniref:Uncharacterized protein n=1 Tax=Mesoterricola silvestris TaxID=2927979 RepID=A0AA48H482_9BACT|nr:type IV toxin-antitoxin system AbiEi family antitoxin [Mesoterricola silvestris]BDU71568.1 hypothetical protein METEAL_07420 [Mesoterricola silvestris]